MRFARGGFRHDHEGDLSRLEALDTLGARQNAAFGRKDARHANEVARSNTRGPQGQLERGELLAVLADTLGEEHLFGNESDHVTLLVARDVEW